MKKLHKTAYETLSEMIDYEEDKKKLQFDEKRKKWNKKYEKNILMRSNLGRTKQKIVYHNPPNKKSGWINCWMASYSLSSPKTVYWFNFHFPSDNLVARKNKNKSHRFRTKKKPANEMKVLVKTFGDWRSGSVPSERADLKIKFFICETIQELFDDPWRDVKKSSNNLKSKNRIIKMKKKNNSHGKMLKESFN